MKKAMFSLVVTLLVLTAGAEGKKGKTPANAENETVVELSGSIVDFRSGELLTGVEVRIEGTNLKTYTDFDGKFSFHVKPGEYKIVTHYISYEKNAESLIVEGKKDKVKIKLRTPD